MSSVDSYTRDSSTDFDGSTPLTMSGMTGPEQNARQRRSLGGKLQVLVLEYEVESGERVVCIRPGQSRTFGRTDLVNHRIGGDPCLSGTHFAIRCEMQRAVLLDLSSTNGTFINAARIREAELQDGDRIVAGTTIFTVRLCFG
jgi:pSer/pThr/pTyr-binding forkhead associated (FHA) protein